MTVPRRYTDRELYEAAARLGDQTAAAVELGLSRTWVGKCSRRYALANGLRVPRNPGGHAPPVPARAPAPDTFSHRRLRDGGVRVREQRRLAESVARINYPLSAEVHPRSAVATASDGVRVTGPLRSAKGRSTCGDWPHYGQSTVRVREQVRQNRSWPPA